MIKQTSAIIRRMTMKARCGINFPTDAKTQSLNWLVGARSPYFRTLNQLSLSLICMFQGADKQAE
jgi:hypothetical protein